MPFYQPLCPPLRHLETPIGVSSLYKVHQGREGEGGREGGGEAGKEGERDGGRDGGGEADVYYLYCT